MSLHLNIHAVVLMGTEESNLSQMYTHKPYVEIQAMLKAFGQYRKKAIRKVCK